MGVKEALGGHHPINAGLLEAPLDVGGVEDVPVGQDGDVHRRLHGADDVPVREAGGVALLVAPAAVDRQQLAPGLL